MSRTRLSSARVVAVATAIAGCLIAAPAAAAAPECTARPAAGGEWPMYGHDSANTRSQLAEHTLSSAAARGLTPAWVFSTGASGDKSAFQTTPVVAGRCVFIGSANAVVYAVDAATGKLVWKRQLQVSSPGLGGGVVGAAAISGGKVIWIVDQAGGPYAIALDRSTGALIWRSPAVVASSGYYSNSSPVVANGLVVVGYSSPEGDSNGQGGFALLSAATGQIVKVTSTVPPARQAEGNAGGGLWGTPAYDPRTQYAYWGTGNPDSKTQEDPNTNAIVKIDLDRVRPKFGQIVAAYKGNVDQYTQTLQAVSQTPVCAASANSGLSWPLDDPVCGQLDLDFGASPNLFTDSAGTELVGDLQKAGVYHVARADTMAPAWTQNVGGPCEVCNAESTAFDGSAIEGVSAPGGAMFSLPRNGGSVNWLTPIADGVHYESVSVADGVAYTIDGNGFLDAFDAATGVPLLKHPVSADVGTPVGGPSSNGLSIAEHRVFVATSSVQSSVTSFDSGSAGTAPSGSGGYLIAYRAG